MGGTAYSDTMAIMLVVATALSVIPLGLSTLMPDWYLGDQQNAVEDPDVVEERSSRRSSFARDEESDELEAEA